MASANFPDALTFVWQKGFDDPDDGYHVTPGDEGGGTYAGVIEATWATALVRGEVTGLLKNATRTQLSTVLRNDFWGSACDALSPGLDLLLFNGRMMSGMYPKIFQLGLGFIGDDVDGFVGPMTLAAAAKIDPTTFIHALTGMHYGYLAGLSSWKEFEGGWTHRLVAARTEALGMIGKPSA